MLDIWKDTFATLFLGKPCENNTKKLQQNIFHICLNDMDNLLMNEHICMYEVELALKHARLNKAAGLPN